MKKLLLVLVLIFILSNALKSQVSVSPMVLIIDPNTRNGTIEIKNVSDEFREFTIELKFGYPKYDSLGRPSIYYQDSILEGTNSLIPYLKLFPKILVIPPKESQTVRVMLTKQPESVNQTYWSRFIVSSQPVATQIDTATSSSDSGKVRARIVMKTTTNGSFIYHNGIVTSVIDFNFYRSYTDSLNLFILIRSEKAGTSQFMGKLIYKIYDSDDNLLFENFNPLAIYEKSIISFMVPKKVLKPGKLRVEITINNERDEIPEESRLPSKPVTKTFEVDYK